MFVKLCDLFQKPTSEDPSCIFSKAGLTVLHFFSSNFDVQKFKKGKMNVDGRNSLHFFFSLQTENLSSQMRKLRLCLSSSVTMASVNSRVTHGPRSCRSPLCVTFSMVLSPAPMRLHRSKTSCRARKRTRWRFSITRKMVSFYPLHTTLGYNICLVVVCPYCAVRCLHSYLILLHVKNVNIFSC